MAREVEATARHQREREQAAGEHERLGRLGDALVGYAWTTAE